MMKFKILKKLGDSVYAVEHRSAELPDSVQRHAEHDGQEDDLENVALNERSHEAIRDDVRQELPPFPLLALLD